MQTVGEEVGHLRSILSRNNQVVLAEVDERFL